MSLINIFRPFAKYTFANLIVKILVSFIVLYFPIILDDNEYGKFVLGYSFFQLIVVFAPAGHYETLISEKSDQKKFSLMQDSLYYLFLACLIVFIASYFFIKDIFSTLEIISIIIGGLSLGYSLLLVKYFFLIQKPKKAIAYYLSFSFSFYIIAFLFTFYTEKWELFFLISSIIGVLFLLCLRVFYFKKNAFNIPSIISMQKKALPYIIIAFVGWLGGYGYNYLVNLELELKIVGAFGFILSISNFILVISNSINLVWSSKLFNYFNNKSSPNKNDSMVWGGLTIVIMLLTIFISIAFPFLVKHFYSSNKLFLSLSNYIPIIGMAYILYVPAWQAKNYYYYNNASLALLYKTSLSGFIGLLFAYLSIKYFSVLGLFVGFLFNYLMQSIIISRYSIKKWKYKVPYKLVALSMALLVIYFCTVQFLLK